MNQFTIVMILLLASMLTSCVSPSDRSASDLAKCKSNLIAIREAKQSWLGGKCEHETPPASHLTEHLYPGWEHDCPGGGLYKPGRQCDPVICSIHGVIPQEAKKTEQTH